MKELETSIRSQVAAEERAHKIVERLVLEDEVTRDFLVNSVSLIVIQGRVVRIRGKGAHLKKFDVRNKETEYFILPRAI